MSAIALLLVGLGAMALGYVFYSQFIAERIYRLDPNYRTPAHTMRDGVDYVPTNKFVLWGHHFTSVAGAAPIVGPAIAVIWGWVRPSPGWSSAPSSSLVCMTSVRSGPAPQPRPVGGHAQWSADRLARAQSVPGGDLPRAADGQRCLCRGDLQPAGVHADLGDPGVGRDPGGAGDRPDDLPLQHEAALAFAGRGDRALRADPDRQPVPHRAAGRGHGPVGQVAVDPAAVRLRRHRLAAAGVVLLQPRDYINGLQLFVGLGLLYLAVLFGAPELVAPAFNQELPADTPSIVPLLFVTIACGAISGFTAWSPPAPPPSSWTRKPTPASSATSVPWAKACSRWRRSSAAPPASPP